MPTCHCSYKDTSDLGFKAQTKVVWPYLTWLVSVKVYFQIGPHLETLGGKGFSEDTIEPSTNSDKFLKTSCNVDRETEKKSGEEVFQLLYVLNTHFTFMLRSTFLRYKILG